MTKEEVLRGKLAGIIAEINEYKSNIDALKADKDMIIDKLNKLIDSQSTVIDYNDIDNIDPLEYILSKAKDDDEIELRHLADILGMSLSTLRSKIDKTQIKRYDRYDRHGTKLVRITIKYLKEFLGDSKSDKDMIECIKYVLQYHHDNSKPLVVDMPLKDLEIPLRWYTKFKKMTISELVAKGLGRGFFIKPQLSSIQRLIFAYNIGYRLQWYRSRFIGTTYTVEEEPIRFAFRIYHKEK